MHFKSTSTQKSSTTEVHQLILCALVETKTTMLILNRWTVMQSNALLGQYVQGFMKIMEKSLEKYWLIKNKMAKKTFFLFN